MKTKTIKHFLILILLSLVLPGQFIYGEVQLTVSNIDSDKGNVMIGIYRSQEDFDEDSACRTLKVPVSSNSIEVSIPDLEAGWYMIALYIDRNSNNRMDRFIVPLEQYGFSNNARGFMGPASFRNARFFYDGKNTRLSIRL